MLTLHCERFKVDTFAGFAEKHAPTWQMAWHPKETDTNTHLYEAGWQQILLVVGTSSHQNVTRKR